jgi:hypothetical protein
MPDEGHKRSGPPSSTAPPASDGDSQRRNEMWYLKYEEATAALARQEIAVDKVRDRAGVLLTAGIVATSFLATRVVNQGASSGWAVAAIILFFTASVIGAAVLLPFLGKSRWRFRVALADIEEQSITTLLAEAIRMIDENYNANEGRAIALVWYSRVAALVYAAEFVCWFWSIR